MTRGSKTRDQLIEHGLELFGSRGYAATGVAEITAAAGVPKGSFYNFYRSKEEFALGVLSKYQDEACAQMAAALAGEEPPLVRLRRLLRAQGQSVAESGFATGCLAGKLAQELAGQVESFRRPLEAAFRCMRGYLVKVFAEAAEADELPTGLDAEELAEFTLNAWQGAALRAKATNSPAPFENLEKLLFEHILQQEA